MSNTDKSNAKFNIKNFSADQISNTLTEHQNSFLKFVLIIGALLMGGMMFNDHRAKVQGLRTKISKVQEKLEAIAAHDVAVGDINKFKSALPKRLNEFGLFSLISNEAKLNHVIISTISPADTRDMGLYDIIKVSIDASCLDFKDMVLFIRKIEKSSFPLRVDAWSGHEVGNGKIDFIIAISAVLIHT